MTVMTNGQEVRMCEINFLCVHTKLRSKKLAPVLIREVTRRVNCENVWQAIYTAGISIPTPFGRPTYCHRNINSKKLLEVGFAVLPHGVPLSRYVRAHKIPEETQMMGLREMTLKDVDGVKDLLNSELAKHTKVHFHWNSEEVKHFLMPQQNVVYSYVVEENNEITDMFSFYLLPSSILKDNPSHHKTLNAAYSYYNVSKSGRIIEGISNMLVLAQKEGFDVFNCLDLAQNDRE